MVKLERAKNGFLRTCITIQLVILDRIKSGLAVKGEYNYPLSGNGTDISMKAHDVSLGDGLH